MPQATLSAARLAALLHRPVTRETLDPVLFRSKAEIARWEGDELVVEATPDRIDLLTETGLSMHLAGAFGSAKGLFPLERSSEASPPPSIEVSESVDPLRPAIAGVVVHAPASRPLDEALLAEAIRFQELLHATRGADRRVASLGIYPYERLRPPIRYAAEKVESLEFVPLGQETTVTGQAFFSSHPHALRYAVYGRRGAECLTLRDAEGTLLSLPPVLNTRAGGEARPGDRVLLLESTGLRPSAVQDMVGLLLEVFVGSGWAVQPVETRTGSSVDPGTGLVSPRSVHVTAGRLAEISGLTWSAAETEQCLAEIRLGGHPAEHGWRVEVPPWRPDLQTETDLVEDLVLARGVRSEEGLIAPSRSRGRRRPETSFRGRAGALLLGAGYTELHSPILSARTSVAELQRPGTVPLVNPPSELFSVFRNTLLLPLVAALGHNVRFGYPQRFFEVGPVVSPDPTGESGTRTAYHAGAMFAAERAGFADAAALVDYLLTTLGAAGVREPAGIPGTIPGRAAVVRLAGERVGELGEVHPRLLTTVRVPVAAVWVELDLSLLWPLLRRHEAA